MQGAGLTLETAEKLGAWVSEVEDLMGHQKPPSGETKVVKAQLQEQKVSREQQLLHLELWKELHLGVGCSGLGGGVECRSAGTCKGVQKWLSWNLIIAMAAILVVMTRYLTRRPTS